MPFNFVNALHTQTLLTLKAAPQRDNPPSSSVHHYAPAGSTRRRVYRNSRLRSTSMALRV